MLVYKITIEDSSSGKSFYFYTSGLEGETGLLEGDFFNTQISDAKTGEKFTIKDKIINALKKEDAAN